MILNIKHLFVFVAMALILSSCDGTEDPKDTVDKPVTKEADIYFRFAMEYALGSSFQYKSFMTDDMVEAGAQCVQNRILAKRLGIYSLPALRSLVTKHAFPEELSSYASFLQEQPVRDSAAKRIKKLGYASYQDAIKADNIIVKRLLAEYSLYGTLHKIHDITSGINPDNLVLQKCAPSGSIDHIQ